jgi:tRNA threonylcarbamoyl adenosine modification protein YeaZ
LRGHTVKILAFDTSTFTASAAVLDGRDVLAESSATLRAAHSERLLPLVDEVLARSGVALSAIERIAVGVGPGSFTGVRLGLATAKGLALATNIPLVGVTSLAAIAASAWAHEGPLLATLDARRDEVYAAFYACRAGDRATLRDAVHDRPEALGALALAAFPEGIIAVVGDLGDAPYQRLTSAAPSRFARAPGAVATPLARFVAWEAREGRARLDEGQLEPEYLRGSDAKLPQARAVTP